MNKLLGISIVVGMLMPPLWAGDAGQTSLPFLTMPAEARGAALGNAYSSVASGSHALWYNPAGLVSEGGMSVSLMHALYLDNISYSTLATALPIGQGQALGFGIGNLSEGNVPSYDANGQSASSYSPSDLNVRLAYARKFSSLRAGLAASFLRSTIEKTATTRSYDAGLQQPLGPVTLALTFQNFGHPLTFQKSAAPLPQQIRLGSSVHLIPSFLLTTDIVKPTSGKTWAGVGLEYVDEWSGNNSVALRTGFSTQDHKGLSGASGFTAGAGYRFGITQLNYAWVPFGDLGQTHRFSVDFQIGNPSSERSVASSIKAESPRRDTKNIIDRTRNRVRDATSIPMEPWKVTKNIMRSSKERVMDLLSWDALCPTNGVQAIVTKVKGTVTMKKAEQVQWERTKIGQYLFSDDVIQTGSASLAQLVLANNVKLELADRSSMQIKNGIPPCEVARVRVDSGTLNTEVGKDRTMTIETPMGVESLSGIQGELKVTPEELTMRVTAGTASFTANDKNYVLKEKFVYRKLKGQLGLDSEEDPSSDSISKPIAVADGSLLAGRWDQDLVKRYENEIHRLDSVPDLALGEYVRDTGLRSALRENLKELEKLKLDLSERATEFSEDKENFQQLIDSLKIRPPSETKEEKSERRLNMKAAKNSLDLAKNSFGDIQKELKNVMKEFRFNEEYLAAVPIARMLNITAQESNIPFQSGQWVIPTEAVSTLDTIAKSIQTLNPYRVIVEGHTDKAGSSKANARLSRQRAESVVMYLERKTGLPRRRFIAKGMGPSHPISEGDSPEQLARNRRVEIWMELKGL